MRTIEDRTAEIEALELELEIAKSFEQWAIINSSGDKALLEELVTDRVMAERALAKAQKGPRPRLPPVSVTRLPLSPPAGWTR